MFAEDMPLLNTPHLVALALRAAEENGVSADRCADRLEALYRETGEAPPVGRDELVARCGQVVGWLRAAGLLEARDGICVLTPRGREALAAHPHGMDLADLTAYPDFAAFLARSERGKRREALADGYDEGYTARQDGKSFTENPYGFATADHLAWENGWCEALDAEEGPGTSPLTGTRRDAN
jgi:hypothetical protein